MKPGRRTFLKHAAIGAAGGVIASSAPRAQSAASQDRTAGANSRLRVALIGCGGQGTGDLRNAMRLGAECVALCDVDEEQVTKAADRIDRDYSQQPERAGRDFRRVLDRPDVDAVIIGTPDHWHALTTILAWQARKG